MVFYLPRPHQYFRPPVVHPSALPNFMPSSPSLLSELRVGRVLDDHDLPMDQTSDDQASFASLVFHVWVSRLWSGCCCCCPVPDGGGDRRP